MNQAATQSDTIISESSPQPVLRPVPGMDGDSSIQEVVTSLPVDHFGTTVYVRAWRFLSKERPPIIIVHDIGEHGDCYLATARIFVGSGYSVYLFDLRGHGRSGRQLGHAPNFNALVKDLLQVAAWARYEEGGKAPIILGHGVGALIVMEFTKHYGSFCQAAVLSAPALELTAEVTLLRRFFLKLLADMMPMMRIPAPLRPRFTKERPALHPSKDEDPTLVAKFPGLTATLTYEIALAIKRAEARFIEYNGSVLILCPEKDAVCTYHHLKKSAAIHADHNLEIADLPLTGHGVFTQDETGREAAVKVVTSWLTRISAGHSKDAAGNELRVSGATRAITEAQDEKPGATKS